MSRAGWLAVLLGLSVAAPSAAQTFEATLLPDEQFEDLGHSIDLSGTTLVATARLATGSVDVFVLSGGAWSLQAELTTTQPLNYGELGYALALDGDVLLAGAPKQSDGSWNDPGYQHGAAFVFRRSGVTWSQEASLQPATLAPLDQFGQAVALSGNVAAVGAPLADPLGQRSGRAWIFRRTAGTWSEEASLQAPDGAAEQRFGDSIALSATTLVVGAPRAVGAVADAGAAYVYVFDGSAWILQQKLVAPYGARGDHFGQSLSLDGDQLAVGVPRRDIAGAGNAGAVAVFLRSGSSWQLESWLAAPAPGPADNLGWSVALQGDVLLAGAPDDDSTAPMAGIVRRWRRVSDLWTSQGVLVGPSAASGDKCGASVALDGDRAASGCLWREGPALGSNGAVDVWSGVLGGGR